MRCGALLRTRGHEEGEGQTKAGGWREERAALDGAPESEEQEPGDSEERSGSKEIGKRLEMEQGDEARR
jgi:hypothetical protein